jgi:hypothetical protein
MINIQTKPSGNETILRLLGSEMRQESEIVYHSSIDITF